MSAQCRRGREVATQPKPKSATETLVDEITSLIDHAAQRMTKKEFRQARAKAKGVVTAVRVRVRASRRGKG